MTKTLDESYPAVEMSVSAIARRVDQEFIDRGAEAAERALPEIKRLLAERRRLPRAAEDEVQAGPVAGRGSSP